MRMFLVNETATTQIYTYGHTLYRHDALPILSRRGTAAINGVSPALSVTSTSALALINASTPSAKPSCTASWIGATPRLSRILGLAPRLVRKRSEEHTSALQSLMRISYSVFCLNKKI